MMRKIYEETERWRGKPRGILHRAAVIALAAIVCLSMMSLEPFFAGKSYADTDSTTITLDLNAEGDSSAKFTDSSNTTVKITSGNRIAPDGLPTATRTGYVFNGWWSDPTNNRGSILQPGNGPSSKAVTYYAHWTASIGKIATDTFFYGEAEDDSKHSVSSNYGIIGTVTQGLGYNYGTIGTVSGSRFYTSNYGRITTYGASSALTYNYGVIENNSETISTNNGIIKNNTGTVSTNQGTILNNAEGGTVNSASQTTDRQAVIYNRGGTIKYAGSGTIYNYSGNVTGSLGDGAVVYNFGGTYTFNNDDATVYDLGGAIKGSKGSNAKIINCKKVNLGTDLVKDYSDDFLEAEDGTLYLPEGGTGTITKADSVSDLGASGGTLKKNGDGTYTLTCTGSDITILQDYSITYTLGGDDVTNNNPTSYIAGTDPITLTNPSRTGYTFTGWTYDGQEDPTMDVTIDTSSTGDKAFTANWKKNSYSITYDLAGGTVEKDNPGGYDDGAAAFTLNNPTRTGYTFTGWSGDENTGLSGENNMNVTIPANSTGDRKYTAHWTKDTYKLEITGIADSSYPTSYDVDSDTITLTEPTRAGYTFTGWTGTDLTGDNIKTVTIAKGSTGDRSYTANWKKTVYTISYTLQADQVTNDNPTEYTIDSDAITLNKPIREGYTFTGWYGTDLSKLTPEVTIPAGSTGRRWYLAQWTPTEYSITYDPAGGTLADGNPAKYYITSSDITLTNEPTRKGYDFAGWTGTGLEEATKAVTIKRGSTGDRSYTATWTPKKYNITYELNDGDDPGNPATYNIESDTIILKNPTRTGYTFTGWSGTDLDGTDNMKVAIPKGSTENRTYTAHWTENVKVTLNPNYDSVASQTIEGVKGDNIGVLPILSRTGYIFNGWWTQDGTENSNWGDIVKANTVFPDSPATYYARWTEIPTTPPTTEITGTDYNDSKPFVGVAASVTGTLPINLGKIVEIPATAAVKTNIGIVEKNNATVTENVGVVEENKGYIATNNNTVKENNRPVSLRTVLRSRFLRPVLRLEGNENKGIDVNNGTTETNNYIIKTNNGIVGVNSASGEITTNAASGVVNYNLGTVKTNAGTVYNGSTGTVETNTGTVYNFDGTITTNSGGTIYKYHKVTGGSYVKSLTYTKAGSISEPGFYEFQGATWLEESDYGVVTVTLANGLNADNSEVKATGCTITKRADANSYTVSDIGDNAVIYAVRTKSEPSGGGGGAIVKKTYAITYDLAGGKADNPATYTESDTLTLQNPTREGYTFTGWSGTDLKGDDNMVVTIPKGSTGDRAYTAHWMKTDYTITYNLAGGTDPGNLTGFNADTETFTLKNPTREGYVFTGWTGTGLSGSTKTVKVTKGTAQNLTFTATWERPALLVSASAKGKTAQKLTWKKVNAAKYRVYFAKASAKKFKRIATVTGSSRTVKGLKSGTVYKYYVIAVDSNGKRIAKSDTVWSAAGNTSGKYANAKSLSVKAGKKTLKVGKKTRLTVKPKLTKKSKKLLGTSYTNQYRYIVTSAEYPLAPSKVVRVSKNGTVTALTSGKAKIYILAPNGIRTAVTITVK